MPTDLFFRPALLALAAGMLLPLAFAPYGQSYLAPLALAALFYSWQQAGSPKQAAGFGYLFGLGQFGLGTWWVYISMHQFSGAGPLAAGLLTLLFVLTLSLYPALAGGLTRWLCRPEMSVWAVLLIFPSIWVTVEGLRGWLLTGFPWLEIGYSQIDSPLAGFAPLFGNYGVGWLTALTGAAIWLLLQLRIPINRLVFGLLTIWAVGFALKSVAWTSAEGRPFQATLLQGNISQDLKWQEQTRQMTLSTYLGMTRQHWDSSLIVWPETAVPAFLHQVQENILTPLEEEAKRQGTDLLIGIPILERESGRYYNAVISLGQTPGVYYKRHLVPFGEFLPLRPLLGFVLDILQIPLSDFSPGGHRQPLLHGAGWPLATTICYEDAFARDALSGLPEASYMVNVSNDAWFGDSIAPHQHLQMARMRALEAGRYLLRATNTGITAIIGPNGKIVNQAAQFVRTSLTGTVQPYAGATPYVLWKDWPLWLGLAGILGWAVMNKIRLERTAS